jgi:hypothetical protein
LYQIDEARRFLVLAMMQAANSIQEWRKRNDVLNPIHSWA